MRQGKWSEQWSLVVSLLGCVWLLLSCAQETGAGIHKAKLSMPAPALKEVRNIPPIVRVQAAEPAKKPDDAKPAPAETKEKEKEPPKKTVSSPILKVKLALMADPRLFHDEIEVTQSEQHVVLSGKVSSETEKQLAADIALKTEGVAFVTNKLEVAKELPQIQMKKRDDAITHVIKEHFARSATLKAADFGVKTEDGVVSLSGNVRFQVIALEAAETARHVPGVKAVRTDQVRLEGTE